MSHHKVPSHGNVPFAWENKPGVSKETSQQQELITTNFFDLDHHDHDHRDFVLKILPLAPRQDPNCAMLSVHHGLRVPPPPGNSSRRVLYRNSSTKGPIRNKLQREEDPFFVAFKECTRSNTVNRGNNNTSKRGIAPCTTNRSCTRNKLVSGLRSFFAVEPCKSLESCTVRDGNLVSVSHRKY